MFAVYGKQCTMPDVAIIIIKGELKMSKKENLFDKINKDFESMSNLVLEQLHKLDEIIGETKIELLDIKYQEIFEREKRIDNFEVIISNDIINAFVLEHQAATSLRMLVSIQRMVVNLERVGDLCMNIVEFLRFTEDNKTLSEKYFDGINNMLTISISMVKRALKSFKEQDKDYAIWTIKNDDIVDDLHRNLLANIINKANLKDETKSLFNEFITMNNIIGNIERIGDNASNIAEASIYFLEGRDIRHNNDKL